MHNIDILKKVVYYHEHITLVSQVLKGPSFTYVHAGSDFASRPS